MSRTQIESIKHFITVGNREPAIVIEVKKTKCLRSNDAQTQVILSKTRLNDPDTIQRCEDTFLKAFTYSILRRVAAKLKYRTKEEFKELLRQTIWKFEAKTKEKGSSYDWLMQVPLAPQILERFGLDTRTVQAFLDVINERTFKLSKTPKVAFTIGGLRADTEILLKTFE